MKYLLLCCFEEKRWEAIPEAQRDGIMQKYGELLRDLDRSGHHLATGQLQPTSTATTVRGKNGGVELARQPRQISIGQVVRDFEPELGLVECLRAEGEPCAIVSACRLKGVFRDASRSFFSTLDRYTLADLMAPRPKLEVLLQLRRSG